MYIFRKVVCLFGRSHHHWQTFSHYTPKKLGTRRKSENKGNIKSVEKQKQKHAELSTHCGSKEIYIYMRFLRYIYHEM